MGGLNLKRFLALLFLPPIMAELGAPKHIPGFHGQAA